MGLIRQVLGSAKNSVSGAVADQWLEVIEPDSMGENTIVVRGVKKRKGATTKGSSDVIPNGSIVHVYDNQCMILTDGGKIVDYACEPGYYKVDNSSSPSMFNGQFGDSLKDAFNRFKFGGGTPSSQRIYFLNLQEIRGLKFGTKNPINYFDNFYNAELFLRAHGSYTVKITNPLKFYSEVCPRNVTTLEMSDIEEQFRNEFLDALQTAINQMSADGIRISYVASKSRELSKYMSETLDEDWRNIRGIEVIAVGVASISYDAESQKLINMRNQGAMMSDPTVREGFMQSSIAQGLQAAGSNANGAAAGFMGMGMGMNMAGGYMGQASAFNQQQMQAQQAQKAPAAATANTWTCSCGTENTGKFCVECGSKKPVANTWTCSCGATNTGKFCTECGSAKPANDSWTCSCGATNTGKFCTECGTPRA